MTNPAACSSIGVGAVDLVAGETTGGHSLGSSAAALERAAAGTVAEKTAAHTADQVLREIQTVIEPKIAQQMNKRGWTEDLINKVIESPARIVATKDTRFDPLSGLRLNDPATGYIAQDGSYVVRNDRTGAIVQISNRHDKNWAAPWD
ncbi:colicin E5-related ribonuclease [Xanthomonas albilineans]